MTNTPLVVNLSFQVGLSATKSLSPFCLCNTFTGPFTARKDSLLALEVGSSLSQVFGTAYTSPWICQFPPDQDWTTQRHECLVPRLDSA